MTPFQLFTCPFFLWIILVCVAFPFCFLLRATWAREGGELGWRKSLANDGAGVTSCPAIRGVPCDDRPLNSPPIVTPGNNASPPMANSITSRLGVWPAYVRSE